MSFLRNAVWVEKYRRKSIDEMVLSKEQIKLFNGFMKNRHFPNLLFYGDVGSGKTTVGLILCKLGAAVLELNASDDRGIGVIRGTVKPFVYTHSDGIRVVFLDEADDMTVDAQRALKRIIEKGVGNARFILTANYLHRLISPIRSRCNCIKFKPPSEEHVIEYLESILEEEEIEFEDDDLQNLVIDHYPDIRQCVETLQLNCSEGELFYDEGQIETNTFNVDDFIELVKEGEVSSIREFIITRWPNYNTVYKEVLGKIMKDKDFKPVLQDAALLIAEYAYRDGVITDRELNFSACCVELGQLLQEEE